MGDYKRWSHLSVDERLGYTGLEDMGSKFEFSFTCDTWHDKVPFSPFWPNNYYRVKVATSMAQPSMITFGNLDPVKQGEILVAHRNNRLMMWSERQEQWTLVCSNCVYDSIVYCIKAAPRECYVRWNRDDTSTVSSPTKFDGAILMREVMEN